MVLTHNRAHLLGDCLESLVRQADPGASLEIVVVDDGSSDGTATVVRQCQASHPQIRYCPRPHGGIAAARNSGIVNATGDVVAFVADDYLLAPDYARTVVSFFRANPAAMIVRFKLVAADDRFLSRVGHAYQEASVNRRIVDGDAFGGHAAMWRRRRARECVTSDHGLEAAGAAAFRREVFDRVGHFDESFERAEDSDLTVRLRAAGIAIHYVPFHLIRHRYDTNLRAVLRTAYLSGRYRWRYYAKHAGPAMSVASLARLRLTSKVSALYWACWRSAQAGSLGRFVAYLPFMALIEGANKAGFLSEARADGRLANASRPAAPSRARPGRPFASMFARTHAFVEVPSFRLNPLERPRGRVRLIATTMVRNEREHLPEMLRNVGAQVDGIVALDDGSSDGSGRLLEASPHVLEVLRNPADRAAYDEPAGHRRLVAAALDHGAEWILSIDADERLERDFRMRAERVIRRGRRFGLTAYAIRLRELWDFPDRYRADGIWGAKRVPRLFRGRADHRFDERLLHAAKAPLQGKVLGAYPRADLVIYHLRMIRPEDRIARRDRYVALDPEARWQPTVGYRYLTDERGLALRRVPPRRDYRD